VPLTGVWLLAARRGIEVVYQPDAQVHLLDSALNQMAGELSQLTVRREEFTAQSRDGDSPDREAGHERRGAGAVPPTSGWDL
jgi:hypothetical protein